MKIIKETINVMVNEKSGYIDITNKIIEFVEKNNIKNGFIQILNRHTSSAVLITDSDDDLIKDLLNILEDVVPENKNYLHNNNDYKKNATAHLKTLLTSLTVNLPVIEGQLILGIYHRIYYVEFDGGREKTLFLIAYE